MKRLTLLLSICFPILCCNVVSFDLQNYIDNSWYGFYPESHFSCGEYYVPALSELTIEKIDDGFLLQESHPYLRLFGQYSRWEISDSLRINSKYYLSNQDREQFIEFIDKDNFILRRKTHRNDVYITVHYRSQDVTKKEILTAIAKDEYTEISFCRGLKYMNQIFGDNFFTFE